MSNGNLDRRPGLSTFSEYGHVAYQFKRNVTCNNVVTNSLPVDIPPPDIRAGVKRSKLNFFRTWSLYITINGGNGTWSTVQAHILSSHTPSTPWVGLKGQNNYSESSHAAFVCSFDLILYVQSTIFHLNRDGSSWVEPVLSKDKCVLFKDHNTVMPVRLEPPASRSGVKNPTTEP